jgi:hypothetical protein
LAGEREPLVTRLFSSGHAEYTYGARDDDAPGGMFCGGDAMKPGTAMGRRAVGTLPRGRLGSGPIRVKV